jgi:zinc protease
MRVVLEESHTLPLVDVELTLRNGSVIDPPDLAGLTRLTWRVVRMGSRGFDANDVEEAISRMGARLVIETAPSYVRLHGVVIERGLEPFLELLSKLLRAPAFRSADLAQAKREAQADLVARRDSDRSLAARAFRSRLFGDHPYGRSALGTRESIRRIRRDHLRSHWEGGFVAENLVFGVAGAVTPDGLRRLVSRHFSDLPRGRIPSVRLRAPRRARGRRIVVVDKPDRTQTQVYVGTLGIRMSDPLYYPMLVANTAFGGTFTAPLMQEVREKRGWSYGAYSRLGADREREAWTMWTHPSTEDAVDCIELQLELLERFIESGPSRAEHAFAKKHLVNSHCFDVDTPSKRLEPFIDADLFAMPLDFYTGFERRVRAVKRAHSIDATKERLSSDDVTIALVATARDVVPRLERIARLKSLEVVPHTQL